jgi:hypothetical protein
LAQDDRLVEDYLSHEVFVLCLNGAISFFPVYCSIEAELAVIVEIAEEFFGAG